MKKNRNICIRIAFFCVLLLGGCDNNIGTIQNLNKKEEKFLKLRTLMLRNSIYILNKDSFPHDNNMNLFDLFNQCELSKVFILIEKDSTTYYEIIPMNSYIYAPTQKNIETYSYCKEKLIKIKDNWYFFERTRFGCLK